MLLAGCQKPGGAGRTIRFSAVTSEPTQTKTAYSGVWDGTWERIDWNDGDVIRIYSDLAVRHAAPTYHWTDYQVQGHEAGTGAEVKLSKATLVASSADVALDWKEGGDPHQFFGVYPATAGGSDASMGTGTVSFGGTIPSDQTGTWETKEVFGVAGTEIYYPDATMYMAAYASGQTETGGITLLFSPAYTAFHISAGTDTDMTINSVKLSSAETNPIAGDFTGTCTGGWAYSSTSTFRIINFSLGASGFALTAGKTVDMVLYALPLEMTGLTVTFDVTSGGKSYIRSLKLKKNTPDATTNAAGFINFAPCKEHYIHGLLIPGSTWTVDNDTEVVLREGVATDWDDDLNGNISYGTGPVVNASGLDEVNLPTHSYKFSIYEPHGQTWKIKVLDPSGNVKTGVTVYRDNLPGGSSDPASGSGELTGTIRGGLDATPGLVEFHLGGSTGGEDCTLSFSVIVDGNEYSINSEVVRGNWGSGAWDYKYIHF